MGRISQETRAIFYMSQYFDKIGNIHGEREKKKRWHWLQMMLWFKKNNSSWKENVNCALEGKFRLGHEMKRRGLRGQLTNYYRGGKIWDTIEKKILDFKISRLATM